MRVRSRISELCQCMGIINTLSKLEILIFIIRIGNLLINSLYVCGFVFCVWFYLFYWITQVKGCSDRSRMCKATRCEAAGFARAASTGK